MLVAVMSHWNFASVDSTMPSFFGSTIRYAPDISTFEEAEAVTLLHTMNVSSVSLLSDF